MGRCRYNDCLVQQNRRHITHTNIKTYKLSINYTCEDMEYCRRGSKGTSEENTVEALGCGTYQPHSDL